MGVVEDTQETRMFSPSSFMDDEFEDTDSSPLQTGKGVGVQDLTVMGGQLLQYHRRQETRQDRRKKL